MNPGSKGVVPSFIVSVWPSSFSSRTFPAWPVLLPSSLFDAPVPRYDLESVYTHIYIRTALHPNFPSKCLYIYLYSTMKWSAALLATTCGLVAAHGDLPIPRIVGGRKLLADLKTRHLTNLAGPRSVEHVHVEKRSKSNKRQSNTSGQCGKAYGSCAVGYCCSSEGYSSPFLRSR